MSRLLERGQDSELPGAGIYLAWIECLGGDLIAAHGYAREAHEAAVGIGSDSLRGLTLAVCAVVDAHRGQAEAVRAEAAQALELLRRAGWPLQESWVRGGRSASLSCRWGTRRPRRARMSRSRS